MDTLESTSQSFIIKVWIEDSAEKGDNGVWHGHITHVTSGKRHYMKNLKEIQDFIAPYLEEMGVQSGIRLRIRSWFTHLTK